MKKKYLLKQLLSVVIVLLAYNSKAQSITLLQQGKQTSIRGLSVVDDSIAWISGSKGYIAITCDGGKNWAWKQVKGFEKADFRDIEAFSGKEAIIMSSGTPAVVLKTIDGGASWKVKYQNTDSAYFFDAMDFADHQHGYILGDPINGKFLLMETKNGGETWNQFKNQPNALPGEAAFAASGTCLRADKSHLAIVTGGSNSRILIWQSGSWLQSSLPFSHQKSSQGAFSVAENGDVKIFVGGDYANDKRTDSVSCYTNSLNHTSSILFPQKEPSGFQSCVEFIRDETFLSTGTSGSNITNDNGKNWVKIDDTSFNVCRKAKRGTLVLLAGNDGKIGILKM